MSHGWKFYVSRQLVLLHALLIALVLTPRAMAQNPLSPMTPSAQATSSGDKPPVTNGGTEVAPVSEAYATLENQINQSQLADTEKAALLASLSQASGKQTAAAGFEMAAAGFQQSLESLGQSVEQAKKELQDLTDFAPSLPSDPTLKELEGMLPPLVTQLATAKSDLTAAESAAAFESKRRQDLQTIIPDIEQQLADQRAALDGMPATNLSLADQVQREVAVAEERRLAAQLDSFRREAALLDAQAAAASAQLDRDVKNRRVETMQQQIEAIEAAIAEKRPQDAAERVETAESQLENLHPALRFIGMQNQKYAEQNQELVSDITEVENDLGRRTETLEKIRQEFQQAKTRVETVGLIEAVGAMLRTLKANLPNVREYELKLRDRQPKINDAQYKLIELKDQRNAKISQIIQTAFNDAKPPVPFAEQEALAVEARKLLEAQRTEYLDPLIRSQTAYFDKLVSASTQEQQIIDLVEEATDYVNQRVLWVRSTRPLFSQPIPSVGEWWFLQPGTWTNFWPRVVTELEENWIRWAIAVVAVLALLRFRLRLRQEIDAIGQQVRRGNCTAFMPTIHAIFMTIAAAGPLTLVLGFTGLRLRNIAGVDSATTAVSQALLSGAMTYFPLEVLRQICRPNGLAIAHFGGNEENVRMLRGWLRRLMLILLPLVVMVTFLATGRSGFGSDVVERYLFLVAAVVMSVMLARLLHPTQGLPRRYLVIKPSGWANRLSFLWYFGSVAIPLALGVLATAGYSFTALQLTWRLYQTLILFIVAGLFVATVMRWVLLRRRDLMMTEARTKREQMLQQQAAGDEPQSEFPVAASEDAAEELRQQMIQTRRLLATVMFGFMVIGLWMLWSDVLTASGQLEAHPLWKSTTTETDMKVDPSGEAVTVTRKVIDNVTIADVAFAIFVVCLTVLATRNVPGLLEFAVLKKLPIDTSIRYAISALSSYAIALVGLIVSGGAIGLHWDQIQWMATALTFGLAFGLQEIFANFVAGVIILFEQPVRVGDIVEIDGVTGVVSKIRTRATTITDWNRKDYIVPNKEFITGKILNWTRSDEISRIVIPVGIAYGSDTERARDLLLKVAADNELVLTEPTPLATLEGFGDNSLNFVLRCFVATTSVRLAVTHELHTGIDQAFRRAGIEISFPQRDLHLRGLPKVVEAFLAGGRQQSDSLEREEST